MPASLVPRTAGGDTFGDQPDKYVEVLAALYEPVKDVDPQAQIVFGGLAYDGWDNGFVEDFLDDVLAQGGGDYFDFMNFHYFTYYREIVGPSYGIDIIGKTAYIRDKLESYGVDKPHICSETCMGSNPGFGTEELQARYVPQVMARSGEAGLDFTVWWWLYDYSNIAQECGLLRENGSLKPAYYAYQTLASELASTEYVGSMPPADTGSDDIEAYEFATVQGSAPVIVAWTNDGLQHQMLLETEQIVMVDKFGATTEISDDDDGKNDGKVTVSVGPSPVYLRYQRMYQLDIVTIGMGTVKRQPNRADYQFGEVVTLTPVPSADWSFGHWGGVDAEGLAFNGDGTWSLTMDADRALTAMFLPPKDHGAYLPVVYRNARP